ncbi:CRISPR-associated endonuclease Cas1 [Amycolatopsis sp. OK19-0408]|uniref:CRISPR-associated endonuclease Cas1 n=1 Tax=Amycolatopsis iheyensis TaxID=2945988 RepID=A0A9X2SNV8_9PSEU|nr:CRISPR-associated endonuclease Cas1 [Amycolatopsis iheyensis]MCR6488393.1 CRISPR-associated endonuclease Cas1 [Amycolatopsis iheyensis]
MRRFRDGVENRLAELSAQLLGGGYEPGVLTEVAITDTDGGERVLRVPAVRDRVVERSILGVLGPAIDALLGPGSFAYRPGLGVSDAVREVARLREEGFAWVLRTDVHDCFPSIPLERLSRSLSALIGDAELVAVVRLLLARQARRPGQRDLLAPKGLPQGSPLSLVLANWVLEPIDERVRRAGFPVVRYGDDFCVVARSRDEAWEAARVVCAAVEEAGMTLGADKTAVMSFADGFTFLGEDFGSRYPPVLERGAAVPQHRTVFLGVQGSGARVEDGRLVVAKDEERLLDVPIGLVARIVCFGAVGVSAGLRNWALSAGIELVFCSHRGRYLGQTIGGPAVRASRLRRQLTTAQDPARSLPAARVMVAAKLRKQAVLLRRTMRGESAEELGVAVSAIDSYLALLPEATSRDELMGLEGAAARAYFQSWRAFLPGDLGFTGRNRRPPRDVVNAALSFGDAVLVSERPRRWWPPGWSRPSASCTPRTVTAPVSRWTWRRSSGRWSSTSSCSRPSAGAA